MQSKQELLKELQEEFGRWEKLLGSLSEEQIVARELPSVLSIQDVVAHLAAWQKLSIARLQAALGDTQPELQLGPEGLDPDLEENLESINEWIHESNLRRTWPEVHQGWREGFLRCMELGKAIPEENYDDPARYPWLHGNAISAVLDGLLDHHHREHLEPLTEWLRSQ